MNQDQCRTECSHRLIIGNSVDVKVNSCDSEIKADIVVSEYKSVRLWGQVKTCNGQPISGAMLKLIKVLHGQSGCEYQGIAHTVSDCKGFYQFDLSPDEMGCSYRILVGKAVAGPERTLCQEGSCNPCKDPCFPMEARPPCAAPYGCRPEDRGCNCR